MYSTEMNVSHSQKPKQKFLFTSLHTHNLAVPRVFLARTSETGDSLNDTYVGVFAFCIRSPRTCGKSRSRKFTGNQLCVSFRSLDKQSDVSVKLLLAPSLHRLEYVPAKVKSLPPQSRGFPSWFQCFQHQGKGGYDHPSQRQMTSPLCGFAVTSGAIEHRARLHRQTFFCDCCGQSVVPSKDLLHSGIATPVEQSGLETPERSSRPNDL